MMVSVFCIVTVLPPSASVRESVPAPRSNSDPVLSVSLKVRVSLPPPPLEMLCKPEVVKPEKSTVTPPSDSVLVVPDSTNVPAPV